LIVTSPCDFTVIPANNFFTFSGAGTQVINSGIKLTGTSTSLKITNNFDNQGQITNTNGPAIIVDSVTISSLKNSGTLTGTGNYGISINNHSTITNLTNTGIINGGINNDRANNEGFRFNFRGLPPLTAVNLAEQFDTTKSIITTLNNSQGGSTPLSYTGLLPTNYNIIINSPNNYGKLVVTNSLVNTPSIGITKFGIDPSSIVTNGT
jgi:hypothetical protein